MCYLGKIMWSSADISFAAVNVEVHPSPSILEKIAILLQPQMH